MNKFEMRFWGVSVKAQGVTSVLAAALTVVAVVLLTGALDIKLP